MDKLVERESAPRNPLAATPALAVQFFLIPLAVIAVAVGVYVGFRSMVTDTRTAADYLSDIRSGGADRQWPAAYELSRLMADPEVRADARLAPALVSAFEQAKDDPRVRRYLALAIGRLGPPLPPDAVAALSASLAEPDQGWTEDWFTRVTGGSGGEAGEARISTIWALGSSGDPNVVPTLVPLYTSSDAGIRKMIVYALGALPGDTQLPTLRQALEDDSVDVRWNAAMALARHGSHDGEAVIRQMLDRPFVEQVVRISVRPDEDRDPVADVMISGLRAAATLKADALRGVVTELSQHDRSLKVRQAALEALKAMG
jgi:HEAT repeat protein